MPGRLQRAKETNPAIRGGPPLCAWGVVGLAVLAWAARGAGGQSAPASGPADSPSVWLGTEGKAEKWVSATAKCRDLLVRFDARDARAARYLPSIRRYAEMLRRTDGFDWRTIPAVEYLENMLADLAEGSVPNRRYAGKGLAFCYWSEAMDRIETTWVHVPPGYDPSKEYQIFMCYKCGGGVHYQDGKAQGGYRPSLEVANQTDTFFAWSSLNIQVKGRMNSNTELAEFTAALSKEFSVSPDRVFLTGYSDGGFTALWVASRWPHLVAGIAPECANWQYANVEQVGLCNVPMLVVDGWSDGGYVERNFSRFLVLHALGADVAGIFGKHGHTYAPFEDIHEFKQILDWAKTRRRDLWPKRVRYATWGLQWHCAFWVSIERLADPCLAGQIDVQVKDGNRIEVSAWNIGAYRLTLGEKLVDPAKAVEVATNGQPSYAGPFREELSVELVKPPPGRFVKSAATPGGVTARIDAGTYGSKDYLKVRGETWLWVRPTGADDKTLGLLAGWWPDHAKPDTEVADKDIAEHHLFLYGGPEVNRLTARIAGDLPVKFQKGRFALGSRTYDAPTACVMLLHPNPLNPRKYVIVFAFNDAEAFARNRFFGLSNPSAWQFREGDCLVKGLPAEPPKWGAAIEGGMFHVEHHVFDGDWRPYQRPPLGELEAAFDYPQLLRLKADAMREAAGTDLAIIRSYTPGWVRWGTRLPAGPVTLHDLAALDMLPEYITVGEVKGSVLYRLERDRATGMLTDAAASSVLTDRRAPSFQPGSSLLLSDIQPEKTYRVAFGYEHLPAYSVNPSKMPDVYCFRSPAEFAAHEQTGLPVTDLRQLPVEVTEAVAQYIRKRGKVAPRPTCFDLAQYLLNPQANEFGAMDWLHLGADVAWPQAGKSAPLRDRYTVNIALRDAAGADLAPPRKNSKQFSDLDLSGEKPATFDLSGLDGKLPVTATVQVRRFAVAAGADKGFRVVPLGAAEGAVGNAILLDLRLVNRGQKHLTGLVALGTTVMRRVNPSLWPARGAEGPEPYYYGLYSASGPAREAPIHEDAGLFLSAGKMPAISPVVERQAGFDFGLYALNRPAAVKAGATEAVPLLLISVDKPADGPPVSLSAVLEAIREEVMKMLASTSPK